MLEPLTPGKTLEPREEDAIEAPSELLLEGRLTTSGGHAYLLPGLC